MDALLQAVIDDQVEDLKFYLNYTDVNINSADSTGRIPLVEAAKLGSREILESLLGMPDVNVNISSAKLGGKTPLMLACLWQNELAISILFEQKINDIDINLQDDNGCTALILTVQAGNPQLLNKLLEHPKIDINKYDKAKNTALIYAAVQGRSDIARILLRRTELNVNHKNRRGMTALSIAKEKGYDEMVAILKGDSSLIMIRSASRTFDFLDPNIRTQEKLLQASFDDGVGMDPFDSSRIPPRHSWKRTGNKEIEFYRDIRDLPEDQFSQNKVERERQKIEKRLSSASNRRSSNDARSSTSAKRADAVGRVKSFPIATDSDQALAPSINTSYQRPKKNDIGNEKPRVLYSHVGKKATIEIEGIIRSLSETNKLVDKQCLDIDMLDSFEELFSHVRDAKLIVVFSSEECFTDGMRGFAKCMLLATTVWALKRGVRIISWYLNNEDPEKAKTNPFKRALWKRDKLLEESEWNVLSLKGIIKVDVHKAIEHLSKRSLELKKISRLLQQEVC